MDALPSSSTLMAGRGCDSSWFRVALTKNWKAPNANDKTLYRQRHKAENTFAKLKDRCRIATHCVRGARTFSAICIVAAVAFYLIQ